jgi:hypothetical protein
MHCITLVIPQDYHHVDGGILSTRGSTSLLDITFYSGRAMDGALLYSFSYQNAWNVLALAVDCLR